jgi:MSHA biogenesis protein MshQ
LLANTPVSEKSNTISYPAGGSFSIVSNAAGAPVLANMNQIAGGPAPLTTYYLYAVNNACAPAFNNAAQTIQLAFECNDPITCQNAPAVVTITPSGGAAVALQKGLPNGTPAPTAAQYTNVTMNFNANSRAPFTMSYADVGMITLYINFVGGGNTIFGESNPFVVKTAGFVLSNIVPTLNPTGRCTVNPNSLPTCAADATGAPFVKAGEAFSATVKAVNAAGVATPNYGHEVTPENVKLTPTLVGSSLTHNPAVIGSFGTFGAAHPSGTPAGVPGVAYGTAFKWDEVGVITLTPSVFDADYLGAGDVTGTPSGNVGRFTLGKFDLQNVTLDDRSDLCLGGVLITDGITSCSTFTYMGEEVDANFILVPMSMSGVALQNYVDDTVTPANDFAKLDPSVFANLNLGAVDSATAATPFYLTTRIVNTGMPVVTCATTPCFQRPGGVGSQAEADVTVPMMFSRGTTPEGAYAAVQIGIAPVDGDGAPVEGVAAIPGLCNNPNAVDCYDLDADAVAGNDHALLAATEFRFGRSKISNAHGSELLPLVMPIVTQYWDLNSLAFVTSVDDNISLVTVAMGNYLGNLVAGDTTLTVPTIVNGIGQIGLSRPGATKHGSVDVTVTTPGYLPGTGRATFGVYKGGNEFIYQREAY